MDQYKKMYLHLFNEVTTAIEILKKAQCECEELYINANEPQRKTPAPGYRTKMKRWAE